MQLLKFDFEFELERKLSLASYFFEKMWYKVYGFGAKSIKIRKRGHNASKRTVIRAHLASSEPALLHPSLPCFIRACLASSEPALLPPSLPCFILAYLDSFARLHCTVLHSFICTLGLVFDQDF